MTGCSRSSATSPTSTSSTSAAGRGGSAGCSLRRARTLGVDLQPVFINYAKSKASPAESYHIGNIQELSGVQGACFDVAVSYISLVDVPDQKAAVSEAFRVLVPGGRFVVCNLSPMATAWVSDGLRLSSR